MYTRFAKTYYGYDYFGISAGTHLHKGPFMVIDCLRQNESINSVTMDVRIEFECKETVPANTIV